MPAARLYAADNLQRAQCYGRNDVATAIWRGTRFVCGISGIGSILDARISVPIIAVLSDGVIVLVRATFGSMSSRAA